MQDHQFSLSTTAWDWLMKALATLPVQLGHTAVHILKRRSRAQPGLLCDEDAYHC